jgi:translation initiation factor IF-3
VSALFIEARRRCPCRRSRTISDDKQLRVNRMIRIPRVLVVDENGEQLGVMETRDAYDLAVERGLDLVEVAPTARPPVCRIMDFGRYKYELSKKAKLAKQKSHQVKLKTIKFRPKTDDHDYNFKKGHIIDFLSKGCKVKVMMQFRGREMSHMGIGIDILKDLVDELVDHGVPESRPSKEGRTVSLILTPKKDD